MCILNCFIRDTIKITRKIEVFNTQNNKLKIHLEKFKKKTRRMRILGARIFLSLLAGKLDHFEQPILTN